MNVDPHRLVVLSTRYAIGNVAQAALAILLLPLYTYYLTAADFGVLALLAIAGSLIAYTTTIPLASALNRFYYRPEYRDRNRVLLFNLVLMLLVKTVIAAAFFWAASAWLTTWLFHDCAYLPLVEAYTFVVALSAVSSFFLFFIQLIEMARFHVVISLLDVALTALVTVVLLAWFEMGVLSLVIGLIFGHGIVILACLVVVRRHVTPEFRPRILGAPLRFGYALLPAGYSNLLMQTGDRVVLGFVGTLGAVGRYSIGSNLGRSLQLIFVMPLNRGLGPTLLKLETDRPKQRQFIRDTATYACAAGVFLAICLGAVAQELIWVLARKPEFWDAWIVVPVVAFSQILHCLTGFSGAGIVYAMRPMYTSAIVLGSAVLNIVLNIALIPRYGILGAAFASLLAYIAWNVANLYFSARFYQLRLDLGRIAHALILGALLLLVGLWVADYVTVVWVGLAAKVLCVVSYPVLLYVTKFLRPTEVDFLKDMIRRLRRNGILGTIKTLIGI